MKIELFLAILFALLDCLITSKPMLCQQSASGNRLLYKFSKNYKCPIVDSQDVQNAVTTEFTLYRENVEEIRSIAFVCQKKRAHMWTFQNFLQTKYKETWHEFIVFDYSDCERMISTQSCQEGNMLMENSASWYTDNKIDNYWYYFCCKYRYFEGSSHYFTLDMEQAAAWGTFSQSQTEVFQRFRIPVKSELFWFRFKDLFHFCLVF